MRNQAKVIVVFILCAAFAAEAQDSPFSISFTGLRVKWGFVPLGADFTFGYSGLSLAEGLNTRIALKAGGGWEDEALFRSDTTGNPFGSESVGTKYEILNFQWDLSFTQGILPSGAGKDLLSAFAFYRGRYDYVTSEVPASKFPDRKMLFYTGFMGGLALDSIKRNDHGLKDGIETEVSIEWGPGLINGAASDYWRFNVKNGFFLPLFDLPGSMNLFSAYFADFASFDYANGSQIPIFANKTFGGRTLRDSLGDCVRGYQSRSYDTIWKAVNNAELRINGPAIYFRELYPIAFAFCDLGYYSGYSASQSGQASTGYLASLGGGIAVNIFDLAQLGAVIAQPLTEKQSFWWAIKLFLHF